MKQAKTEFSPLHLYCMYLIQKDELRVPKKFVTRLLMCLYCMPISTLLPTLASWTKKYLFLCFVAVSLCYKSWQYLIPCPYSLPCAALLISAARKVPQLRAQTIAAVKAAFFEGPFLPFSFYGPVSRCASSTGTTQQCMQKNMARSSWQLKWTI